MSCEPCVVRSVAWRDLCAWILLFRLFRLSVTVPLLLLALAGALATTAGWRVVSEICLSDEALTRQRVSPLFETARAWPGTDTHTWTSVLASRPVAELPTPSAAPDSRLADPGVLRFYQHLPVYLFVEPFRRLFRLDLSWSEFFFYLLGGLWTVGVWGLFGGAIARIAAVRLGRDERVGLGESIVFARQKWLSFVGAPCMGLTAIAVLAIPLWILGWIMRINLGVAIAGLGWALVALIGLLMALFGVGLLFGWPLMWSTIASEGSDSFDAFSRAYSYPFQRPLHYLAYAALTLVLGLLGWVLVALFCDAIVGFAHWAVSWGAGSERMREVAAAVSQPTEATNGLLWFGAKLIAFFDTVVRSLLVAFQYSFLWVAAVGIYLLLRQDTDQTEIDDIYFEDESATPYGLPVLPPDEAGVPGVDDQEAVEDSREEDSDA